MIRGRYRTGESAGIWLAITLALALHVIFLFLPITGQKQITEDRQRPIEIELATVNDQPPASIAPAPEPASEQVRPVTEQVTEARPSILENPPEKYAPSPPANPLPPSATARTPGLDFERDFDRMSEVEKTVLTSTILARQYITEESAADRLFGKPLVQESGDIQKEFHYPLRPDLIEMLNQPVPDLPFDYTPGLIRFAYDPGIKGDLQRFWDVVTPEFGWRTRYGTEVKCALILIIPGCVWK